MTASRGVTGRAVAMTAAMTVSLIAIAATTACTGHRPVQTASDRFDRRAAQVIGQWPKTDLANVWDRALIPLQTLTIPPSPADFTASTRDAFTFRYYVFTAVAPPPPSSRGIVTFADDTTMSVPVETAQAAYAPFYRRTGLPACAPRTPVRVECTLTVTTVKLGTTTLRTSRGPAAVPAWLLTTAQLPDPIARVAVPLSAMTTVPVVQFQQPEGVDSVKSAQSVDGTRVSFLLDIETCEKDIRPRVYETSTAVVIGGVHTTLPGLCSGPGQQRLETVTLKAPLGRRVLLNISSGMPVLLGWETNNPMM